jgi:hypothetical protein
MRAGPRYVAWARTAQEKSLPILRVLSLAEKVSMELLPSNSCCTVGCLHSCYMVMGLYAQHRNES